MKKFFALALAVVMMLSLTSCIGDNIRGIYESNRDQIKDTLSDIKETASDIKETASNINSLNDAVSSVADEVIEDFKFGATNGGAYKNTFLGLGITLDSSWRYLTDAEIAELNGYAQSQLDDELAEKLKNAPDIYDMQAIGTNNATVFVNFEKLNLLTSATMTSSSYIDIAMPQTKTALEGIGAQNLIIKKETVTVAGKTENAIKINYQLNGIEINQIMVCLKRGGYMALVSSATYDGTDPFINLSKFKKL